jgi:hypothetical protein
MVPAVPDSGFDTESSVDPLSVCSLGHVVAEARLVESIATIQFDPPSGPRTVPRILPNSHEQHLVGACDGWPKNYWHHEPVCFSDR